MESELLNYTGQVRRIDLHLRAEHPYLKTKIYYGGGYEYLICVWDYIGAFDDLQNEFDHSIRYVTCPVRLTNQTPSDGYQEIDPISDQEVPSNFDGLSLSRSLLANLISALFPEYHLTSLHSDHATKKIVYSFANSLSREEELGIAKKVESLSRPYRVLVQSNVSSQPGVDLLSNSKDGPSLVMQMHAHRAFAKLGLPFLRQDEAFWFDNLAAIYRGEISKKELRFYKPDAASCYIDFSVFKNINLRNHLLLHDVIYITLPLLENFGPFLESQKITRAELLGLIEKGRVVLLNTQPEIRLDVNFLQEAYERNQASIASRRAVAALCAMDLVSINKNYILNQVELEIPINLLIESLANITRNSPKEMARVLFWPQIALRKSFETLLLQGPMGISHYGTNLICKSYFHGTPREKEMEFEFVMNATAIHIAHALNATYYPFNADDKYSDHPFACLMDNLLNVYKCFRPETLQEYQSNWIKTLKQSTSDALISVYEVNEYIPILRFESELADPIYTMIGRRLFDKLSQLSDEERKIKIQEYNQVLSSVIGKKTIASHAIDVGAFFGGLCSPFVSVGELLLKKGASMAKDKIFSKVLEIIDKSKIVSSDGVDMAYLTKISHVARLRKSYVD